jgi:hypothetical protein
MADTVGASGRYVLGDLNTWVPNTVPGVTDNVWDVHMPAANDVWAITGGTSSGVLLHLRPGTSVWTILDAGTPLNGVWAAGPNDAWAAGPGGAVFHYTGGALRRVDAGTSETFARIYGVSPDLIWATTIDGGVFEYSPPN